MKTLFLIGRELDCDIILWSDSNEISRHHAQIRIDEKGKLWLMDTSLNGTYLNGERILTNIEIEVTKKDIISFAGIETLNWKNIPNKSSKIVWIVSSLILLVILGVLSSILLINNRKGGMVEDVNIIGDSTIIEIRDDVTILDSISNFKIEQMIPHEVTKEKDIVKNKKKSKKAKLTPAEIVLQEIEENRRIRKMQQDSIQKASQNVSVIEKDSIVQQEVIDPIY